MKLINRHVITEHAEHWEQIGRILDVQGLGNIKQNCRQLDKFYEECLRKTLERWLQIDVKASWSKLDDALTQAIRDDAGVGGLNITSMLFYSCKITFRNGANDHLAILS